jgi:hypothetical protein
MGIVIVGLHPPPYPGPVDSLCGQGHTGVAPSAGPPIDGDTFPTLPFCSAHGLLALLTVCNHSIYSMLFSLL